MATEPIALNEGPTFTVVLIHLVARHYEHALQMFEIPAALQHVAGALHIGGVGAEGIAIRLSDERLSCHMDYDLRIRGVERIAQRFKVANICNAPLGSDP